VRETEIAAAVTTISRISSASVKAATNGFRRHHSQQLAAMGYGGRLAASLAA
jgi:hypothetical protein